MLPPLRCRICRRQRPAHSSGFCACGASVWELIEHEPPPGVAVEALSGAPALEPVNFNCVLSEALGGVVPGRKIAIGGEPGAGKSTVCAELASKMAEKLGGLAYWLDAEQDRALVDALFARTKSPTRYVRRIGQHPDDPAKPPISWRDAFAAVPPSAAVMVIDSVQAWTNDSQREQSELLQTVRTLSPTVLVISHFTKQGRFAGSRRVRYDVDATVAVERTAIRLEKCRWTPTPRITPRS
jgi:predicted ATP-dependent serine protease